MEQVIYPHVLADCTMSEADVGKLLATLNLSCVAVYTARCGF